MSLLGGLGRKDLASWVSTKDPDLVFAAVPSSSRYPQKTSAEIGPPTPVRGLRWDFSLCLPATVAGFVHLCLDLGAPQAKILTFILHCLTFPFDFKSISKGFGQNFDLASQSLTFYKNVDLFPGSILM